MARKRQAAGERKRSTRKPRKPELDRRAQRRVLRFLNDARRPQDLAAGPRRVVHTHVELAGVKGPDLHEPMPEHEIEPVINRELAERLIAWRDEHSPLYGFLNIRQFLDLIPEGLLDDLIGAFGASAYGQWDDPIDIPAAYDRPVHAALLRDGRVLFFGLPNGDNTFLWNPAGAGAAAFSAPTNQPTDSLFCSGHAFLSDGRLLVAGGGGDGTGPRHNHGWAFDPGNTTWTRTAGDGAPGAGDMAFFRWYPTLVTMGDEPGRVFVVSGSNSVGASVPQMEMYFETSDRFERVWGPAGTGDTTANRSFPQLYPGLNLLPGGEVFYTPTGWASGGTATPMDYPLARPSAYFEFASTSPPVTGAWTNVGTVDPAAEATIDRVKGMAVLLLQNAYPFVRVLVVGGGESPPSTTTFQMINLSGFTPEWGPSIALPDGLARVNVNLVLLPDGTVFMCGGRPLGGTPASGGKCWICNASTPMPTWSEADELTNQRQYHSVALLLPDARVAVAGDEDFDDRTIEVFSPPYLFNPDGTDAPRPTISSTSPAELVHHGNSFTIETPDASDVVKVVLARPMAVTHQTDSEQRVIPVSFAQSGATTLTATAPDGWHPHALCPRGWYMLFVLNADGVPSVARFLYIH